MIAGETTLLFRRFLGLTPDDKTAHAAAHVTGLPSDPHTTSALPTDREKATGPRHLLARWLLVVGAIRVGSHALMVSGFLDATALVNVGGAFAVLGVAAEYLVLRPFHPRAHRWPVARLAQLAALHFLWPVVSQAVLAERNLSFPDTALAYGLLFEAMSCLSGCVAMTLAMRTMSRTPWLIAVASIASWLLSATMRISWVGEPGITSLMLMGILVGSTTFAEALALDVMLGSRRRLG